ncbi:uncharacterized protein [Diadema antillarum]|uniref:uncharacterized protein n=1 Tax=Diadema antillarum TaxID=105358 RepID=UPI003A8A8170
MSGTNRRGAIYLHRSDMETLKNSTSREKSTANGAMPTANSSGKLRSRPQREDIAQRRAKSTTPPTVTSRRLEIPMRRSSTVHDNYPRRGSILTDYGGPRRGSMLPDFARRGSNFPGDGPYNRRGSRMVGDSQSMKRKPKPPEPEPALTKEQVEAFQEVFDLFDSNGGGTIDADELQSALSSVDIHLPAQDIRDVLETIDKDGSGEIDFEEFLQLMTSTEKFLETFAASHDEHAAGEEETPGGRETVLFDALTKFMKTSALKQMDVLERYFNTKYKRAQAPHVVMHYAAGARLIGLTEKQLVQHLDRLQASNEGYDYKSPYAEPLRIMLTPQRTPRKKKKKPKKAVEEEAITEVRPRLTGKIRIRVHFREEDETKKPEEVKKENDALAEVKETDKKREKAPTVPRLGWVKCRVKSIADRLPKVNTTYTMDDLMKIRKGIQYATMEYHRDLVISRREDNMSYWKTLKCHRMTPAQRMRFKSVFHSYSKAGQRYIAKGL